MEDMYQNGPRDIACARFDCLKIVHRLYQYFPAIKMGARIRFLGRPAVGPTDGWLCSSHKRDVWKQIQARPNIHILQLHYRNTHHIKLHQNNRNLTVLWTNTVDVGKLLAV